MLYSRSDSLHLPAKTSTQGNRRGCAIYKYCYFNCDYSIDLGKIVIFVKERLGYLS